MDRRIVQKGVEKEDRVIGKHVYGSLYECRADRVTDRAFLEELVKEAVILAKATLRELMSWEFGGEKGGVSVIAIVEESHIALHTWKEYNYCTLDVYTCGGHTDPEAAFDHIVEGLRPSRVVKHFADRSM